MTGVKPYSRTMSMCVSSTRERGREKEMEGGGGREKERATALIEEWAVLHTSEMLEINEC